MASSSSASYPSEPSDSESSDPPLVQVPAGGLEFADAKSGLAYHVPDGWFGPATKGLIKFFTSYVTSNAADSSEQDRGAIAGSGLFSSTFYDPAAQGIEAATKAAAAGFSEFFEPNPGTRKTLLSKARTIDGHQGWQVRYQVTVDAGDKKAPLYVNMIGVMLTKPAYVVTASFGGDKNPEAKAQELLASVHAAR